jgi:hypothetical protein
VLTEPTLSGRATVVHRRTGETVRLDFSAQHDGRAGFKCKVGNERLTLADLDPDAALAVRVGALSGLAEQATTPAGARHCWTWPIWWILCPKMKPLPWRASSQSP